ncbi:MAG: hypothetical protein DCC75_01315 [Proteobacteria bacterium]|nr:MAG: hypothetical protein DCC75_01315 [Pseudomonadota bacterium]
MRLLLVCIAACAISGSAIAEDSGKFTLPAHQGQQLFGKIELSERSALLVVRANQETVLFDLNMDRVLTQEEEFRGELKDRKTPLFRGQKTVLVSLTHPEFGQFNVEWDPSRTIKEVYITRGPVDKATDLVFCPLESCVEKAQVLRFKARERVITLYGQPFKPHRGGGNSSGKPALTIWIGYPGEGERSFVTKCYTLLPKDQNPVAEITFKTEDGKVIEKKLPLGERGCGTQFYAEIDRMPEEWTEARIKVYFPKPPQDWEVKPLDMTVYPKT